MEVVMTWLDERDRIDAQRLEAEIANEPQWVVFDDPSLEDTWASVELAEISLAAAWWVGVRA
jgi:hypothetical protein